jgi:hypothetical protein
MVELIVGVFALTLFIGFMVWLYVKHTGLKDIEPDFEVWNDQLNQPEIEVEDNVTIGFPVRSNDEN